MERDMNITPSRTRAFPVLRPDPVTGRPTDRRDPLSRDWVDPNAVTERHVFAKNEEELKAYIRASKHSPNVRQRQ
jgi:hypothetical protein